MWGVSMPKPVFEHVPSRQTLQSAHLREIQGGPRSMVHLWDDPLTLECKLAAQEWLQSSDLLIRDFGARLLCLLRSRPVPLGEILPKNNTYVPPQGLLPEEFKHYPWGPGVLRGKFEHKNSHEGRAHPDTDVKSLPLREFYALEDTEHVGLRLGMFWASPHFRCWAKFGWGQLLIAVFVSKITRPAPPSPPPPPPPNYPKFSKP